MKPVHRLTSSYLNKKGTSELGCIVQTVQRFDHSVDIFLGRAILHLDAQYTFCATLECLQEGTHHTWIEVPDERTYGTVTCWESLHLQSVLPILSHVGT